MKPKYTPLLAALLAVLPLPALAVNVITDPGFENTAIGDLPGTGAPLVWNYVGENPANMPVQSNIFRNGTKALALDALNLDDFSSVSLTTGSTLTSAQIVNKTWNWSFWVYTSATNADSFYYSFGTTSFPNNASEGTVVANTLLPNTWTQISGSFTVGSSVPDNPQLAVEFISFPAGGPPGAGTSTFYIDDITLQSVPEPSTSLSMLAALGLLARRRR